MAQISVTTPTGRTENQKMRRVFMGIVDKCTQKDRIGQGNGSANNAL